MKKGKGGKSKSTKKSDKSDDPDTPPTTPKDEAPKSEPEPIKPDIRKIVITVESFENIMPMFPIADISAKCDFMDKPLGETEPVPITDDNDLPINQSFSFEIDVNNPKEMDLLISKPTMLSVTQRSGQFDEQLYDQLKENLEAQQEPAIKKSFDSVVSMYEAFVGEKVTLEEQKGGKKGKDKKKKGKEEKSSTKSKGKKGSSSKSSKVSTSSKKSMKSDTGAQVKIDSQQETKEYGITVIDFLPLFYGKNEFQQKLLIKPQVFKQASINTYKNHPSVTISVKVEDHPKLMDNLFNVLFLTIESIYNIPSLMAPDKDYKVCCILPSGNTPRHPIIFGNSKYATDPPREDIYKSYPNTTVVGDQANVTKHKINTCYDDIKNKVGPEMEEVLRDPGARLEFNCVKRNILFRDGFNSLASQVQTFRKIPIEIYMTPKVKGQQAVEEDPSKVKKNVPFLHLMGIVDVSSLLYPGITKVRVACPLSTFSPEEALKFAGLEDSFFAPRQRRESPSLSSDKSKPDGGGGKKKKKEKPEKGSKKSSKKDKTEEKNLKGQLPPKLEPLPEPEPSIQVFNELGKPCFILVEIELVNPINERQNLEDLIAEFEEIKAKYGDCTKIVLTNCVAKNYFKETIGKIAENLNKMYPKYLQEKTREQSFVNYLEKSGEYQKYITSITEAATLTVRNKFKIDDRDLLNEKTHHDFIGEVFNYLVSEMNKVLNTLVCNGLVPPIEKKEEKDESLFYAKEAMELKRYSVAETFLLERICNENTANTWFDFAIYNLEIGEKEKALECVKESLAKDSSHRYSMLLMAMLTDNNDKKDEAETIFLNLMIQEARWLEAWGILYLFYQKYNKFDGMDVAMDMAKKYCDDERKTTDYFSEYKDLAWCSEIVPHSIFFKAAILLIKLRLFNWAEMALAQETAEAKNYGVVNYLISTIYFYQRNYEHALEHIEEAKEYYGCDYAVGSMRGHILMSIENYEEAAEEYFHVLESFNRPQNIHLVYINCALCLEQLGRDQEARKMMLLACKFNPSPFSWYSAAVLYYKEKDYLSTEECLTEANVRDNRDADIWGFLCLVNLKLRRLEEAELCYQQAFKNGLKEELMGEIQREFSKHKYDQCLA